MPHLADGIDLLAAPAGPTAVTRSGSSPARVGPACDLSHSTTPSLRLDELLDLVGGATALADLELGYCPPAGHPELRRAIAALHACRADEVLTTQGAAHALFLIAFAACSPGEAVLVTPCFEAARSTLTACGIITTTVPVRFEDRYELDPDLVVAMLTPRTRLVSLASPQNPSGVVVPLATLQRILDAMARLAPAALLLVDESYRLASYGKLAPAPTCTGLDRRVVTMGSLSKAHGVPGLRVGWMTVGDRQLRTRLEQAKTTTVLAGSTLDEILAAVLLQRGDALMARRRHLLAEALTIIEAWQRREQQALDWVRPHAGALCCLRLRSDGANPIVAYRFQQLLSARCLALAPGAWFGDEARVFRLGFGSQDLGHLSTGLQSISAVLQLCTAGCLRRQVTDPGAN